MIETISSIQNLKIKEIIKLRKTSRRKKEDLIIIEGYEENLMAIAAGIKIENLFYCKDFAKNKKINHTTFSSTTNVEKKVFEKISLRKNPDGYISIAVPRYLKIEDIKLSDVPLIVILESVEKPGNLGAILRTCDAAKVDAIIIDSPKTDIYNHNVIRSSLGTVFTNQIAISDQKSIVKWLKINKTKIIAATPNTNLEYTDVNYKLPTAVIIGTEHEGLTDNWLKIVNNKVKIPMLGKINSLNASVSAGIIIFEAKRQRK